MMVGKRRARRLLAHLYDVRKAAPRRTPSAAVLAAVAKATREHQARAAERHGFSREEMAATDPGPGWNTDPTTHKEEPEVTATDTDTADMDPLDIFDHAFGHATHLDGLLSAAQAEAAQGQDVGEEAVERVIQLQEEMDAHLLKYREILGQEPWLRDYYTSIDQGIEESLAAAPVIHGQRIAFLLGTVATNQARDRLDRMAADAEQARAAGPEAVAALEAERSNDQALAEPGMAQIPWHNQLGTVAPLADALVWQQTSPTAAQARDALIGSFAAEWGVLIDPDALTVDIDPDFDAASRQQFDDAASVYLRETAAIDIISAMPLPAARKAAVSAALTAWRADIDPANPTAYEHNAAARREQLRADLDAAHLPATDRAAIDFTIDYLRVDTERTDLLASPVFVDPGQEARGRMHAILSAFAEGKMAGPAVAQEISVLCTEDQQQLRDVGRAIQAGQAPELDVFPGYLDRDAVYGELYEYARDAQELRGAADYLPEALAKGVDNPELWGLSDDVGELIPRMAATRDQLLAVVAPDAKGAASMELAHITATISDIDTGRIRGHEQLPEVMWCDERSKREIDSLRTGRRPAQLAQATKTDLAQLIENSGKIENRAKDRIDQETSAVAHTISSVAAGSPRGIDTERKDYMASRGRLGQALADAGVDQATKTRVRELLDTRAREAAQHGQAVTDRPHQWDAKVDKVIAARDDAASQRQAATAGRLPDATARACAARPDRAAQAATAVGATVGRRQLHDMGVER